MTGDRWYRQLLRVLPFDFRADYGDAMEQVFRAQRHDAADEGFRRLVSLWFQAARDIFAIGPREHLAQLGQDARCAMRGMRRQPGFVAVAVMTLALGIGANTAIFSVVHAVLLQSLPYRDAGSLVSVWNRWTGATRAGLSDPEYLDYAERSRSLAIAAVTTASMNVGGGAGDPERVGGALVTTNAFEVLGLQPALGRGLAPVDDARGGPAVAVISDGLWRRRFAADAGIIGRAVAIDGTMCEIVGVLGPRFLLPAEFGTETHIDVIRPLPLDRAAARARRGGHYLQGFARLRPGATVQSAAADMDSVNAQLLREYPDQYKMGGFGISVVDLRDDLLGSSRPVLLILAGAVGLVLLLACANVANLMLARGEARRRELAVRTALGASRFRIMRQVLTESCLLAMLGAAAGLGVAAWCLQLVLAIAPAAFPRLGEVSLSRPVLLFAVGLAVLTGLIFGLIPASQVSRVATGEHLKDGGRGGSGAAHTRVRRALVVCQVTIAVVLLAAGGLLLKSFARVLAQPAGIDPSRVLTMRVSLPAARYPGLPEVSGFFTRLIDGLTVLPGVETAGAGSGLPLAYASGDWSFDIEGRALLPNGQHPGRADWYVVTPGYFESLGIPLVRGRVPSRSDDEGAPPAVFINETTARTLFANENPIGRRILLTSTRGPKQPWRTIAGIVADVRQRGLDQPPRTELFIPYRQFLHFSAGVQARAMSIVVKTTADPATLASATRARLREIDPEVPPAQIRDMETVLAQSVSDRRLNVALVGAFAVLALVLAAIGLYGVLSYSVAQRTREIGVRLAVGASRASVLALVVGDAMRLIAVGIGLGLAAALVFGGVLSTLLFEVSARDVSTLAVVAAVLFAAGGVASYLPARRAMRVDPVVALRAE
jgi:putative ABC transport system permease protein